MASKQMLGGCCVCLDERGWKENPLVYCDGAGCDVAVHKNCYGITKVPSGPWYCQKCASKETGEHVRCCLCPKLEGVLKKTDDNRWAHVLCALYIPEIRFGNVTTMEPIIVSGIPVSSFNSNACYICEENERPDKEYGVCLNCFKPNCKTIFHVSCGQVRGLLGEEEGCEPGSVQYCGYCAIHTGKPGPLPSRDSSNNSINGAGEGSVDDKRDLSTPLSVDTTGVAEKPKARSRAKPQATGGAKPKRARKPATKKGAAAAAALAKLSPQLKSPLRSPAMRSPTMRSPTMLLSPANRSPISLSAATAHKELLEQQFELSKKMLENQAPLDIAQLLTSISMIQHENEQLEAEVRQLTLRRDNLVNINARLAQPLPTTSSVTTATTTSGTLPSFPTILSNGPTTPSTNHSVPVSHHQRSMTAHLPQASIYQTNVKQMAPASHVTATTTGATKDAINRKSIITSTGSKEVIVPHPRKRPSESSVIKTNTKQVKQSSTPPTGGATGGRSSVPRPSPQQQKNSDSISSHFPWPSPSLVQTTSSSATSSPTAQHDPAYSSHSQVPPTSRLPSINALSQARSVPQLSVAPSSYPYSAAAAASMANYPTNTAAVAALAGYASYPQFPMFGMGGMGAATLSDMATLNPSALTGLAMQGLHNQQQYYRKAAGMSGAPAQKSKPGSGVE